MKIITKQQGDLVHVGGYTISDGMVHVSYFGAVEAKEGAQSKPTQIGGSTPKSIAMMLLSELVRESRK